MGQGGSLWVASQIHSALLSTRGTPTKEGLGARIIEIYVSLSIF